jgi:glutamate-1-semialdehyde 2,1-aminomutase
VDLTINRVGSMLTLFFTAGPVSSLEEAKKSDLTQFRKYFQGMLEAGISLPPSQFEALFISRAHTPEDLEFTVAAAEQVWARWR